METLNNLIVQDAILESALSRAEFADFLSSRVDFVAREMHCEANSKKVFKYGDRPYQVDISLSLICLSLTSPSKTARKIREKLKARAGLARAKRGIGAWQDAALAAKVLPKLDFLIGQSN